jgi:hypothetical protein
MFAKRNSLGISLGPESETITSIGGNDVPSSTMSPANLQGYIITETQYAMTYHAILFAFGAYYRATFSAPEPEPS